jgi:hypothetical protein
MELSLMNRRGTPLRLKRARLWKQWIKHEDQRPLWLFLWWIQKRPAVHSVLQKELISFLRPKPVSDEDDTPSQSSASEEAMRHDYEEYFADLDFVENDPFSFDMDRLGIPMTSERYYESADGPSELTGTGSSTD